MRSLVFAACVKGCAALFFHADVSNYVSEGGASDHQMYVRTLVRGHDCLGGWNAINPSFVFVPDSTDVAVAFRGLCLHKDGPHASWYSKMVVGTVPVSDLHGSSRSAFNWKSLSLAPDLRRLSSTRRECHMVGLDTAHGPEDPRLVKTEDGLFAIVTGYDVVEEQGGGSPVCGEHGMLLYAAKVTTLSPPTFGPPVQLTFKGMGQVEKNWAMFTLPDSTGANVLAVYSVYPHTIAEMSLYDGDVTFIAQTKSAALASLARQLGTSPESFHGGGGVAHNKLAVDGNQHFLSVLHIAVRRQRGGTEYWNYPYMFSNKPPFNILRIGKKLPLQLNRNPAYGEYVAFVTTVMLGKEGVFIGYGSGDSSSRIFTMPHAEFEATFFPSTSSMEEVDVAEDVDAEDLDALLGFRSPDAVSQCSGKVTQVCRDNLTPSVCRSCHEGA